ncbi:glycosyltransferase family 4 protein [Rossellomorea aquimaris]|uniref:Glycosyltransferase family 4 protein n=1 Tax=Rossellomorea aquimaris TaxID=189382 RepID=A0A5D4UC46_9BACI|nr:glycosyltransferase family 4 protein [Rossellomorea aquimaris]TYS78934.1 glycosyltransferase family 4 protein [Rossellomorea aquimaris]TYS84680.1 glycosyltransferase family 4 protein [Rossellomorea aquimaris]
MKELFFPYPYLVSALDNYYGVKSKPITAKMKDKGKDSKRKKERKKKLKTKKKKSKPGSKKLSILIATFWDYPHTGGLSNYITTLREGLRSLGHKVDVIAPNQFSQVNVEKLREVIVPELKTFFEQRYGSYTSKIIQSCRLLYIYEQMMKSVKLEKYDILHAQDLFTANILGRFNEDLGKPLLFTPHGMFTFSRVKFSRIEKGSVEEVYYKEIEKKAIEYATHMVILSDSFRDPLSSLGAKPVKLTTVNTGVDFKTIERGKTSGKIVISCIARLGPRKGHSDLFNALSRINGTSSQVEVQIVGDGEMREALETQVKSLRLPNVRFLGKRDDVPAILSKTDIFVLPTINDNLPISIIEAMHSGAAILTTNCGGITEIVHHNETGIIVEPGNVSQLTTQLKHLIGNEALRKKLGANAYRYAKNHLTREAMVGKIEGIYQNLIDSGDE